VIVWRTADHDLHAIERLRQLVEQSRRRSAVFDVVTASLPVTIEVNA